MVFPPQGKYKNASGSGCHQLREDDGNPYAVLLNDRSKHPDYKKLSNTPSSTGTAPNLEGVLHFAALIYFLSQSPFPSLYAASGYSLCLVMDGVPQP